MPRSDHCQGIVRRRRHLPALFEGLESRSYLTITLGQPDVANVSRMTGQQAEETIAVNPLHPSQVFMASNNDDASLFGAVSSDGGKTWATRVFATGSDNLPRALSDPIAAFDSFGNLFFTYLGKDSN